MRRVSSEGFTRKAYTVASIVAVEATTSWDTCCSAACRFPDLEAVSLLPSASSGPTGQGIGSELIRTGLETCTFSRQRCRLVVGEPDYYTRFGFSSLSASSSSVLVRSLSSSARACALESSAPRNYAVEYPAPFQDL